MSKRMFKGKYSKCSKLPDLGKYSAVIINVELLMICSFLHFANTFQAIPQKSHFILLHVINNY